MSVRPELATESLMGHLLELRARLVRAVVVVLLVFVALLPFAEDLYAKFAAPLLAKLPAGGQLVAIDVASPFFTPIKLAFFVAVLVAAAALPRCRKIQRALRTDVPVAAQVAAVGPCEAFAECTHVEPDVGRRGDAARGQLAAHQRRQARIVAALGAGRSVTN